MAAITAIATAKQNLTLVRTGAAQANTGQTDWVARPRGATRCMVYLNMTASGGSTPGPTLVHLRTVDPVVRDDTNIATLLTATVGLTNTGLHITEVNPNRGAADVTNSATHNAINAVLPDIMGINVVLDRTNGDETYTYTLRVEWS